METYEIEIVLRNGLSRSFQVRMTENEKQSLNDVLKPNPDVREYHFWPNLGDMSAMDFLEEFSYWKDSEL